MIPRANVEDDVVGGSVAMAFLDRVQNRFAIVFLRQDDEIRDVRGPVVAGGLEAELVALVEGAIDEAIGIPAGDIDRLLARLCLVAGARRPLLLVGHAVALVDLDDRLDVGIIVAPVGAHAGGAGVYGAEPAHLLEVAIQ